MNKHLSLSVGIPTCYGGQSLIDTLKSIRKSDNMSDFPLIVVADRTPISENHRKQIDELNIDFTWNSEEGSQFKKLGQIIDKVKTDIFVFTQDDIVFDQQALEEIRKSFENDPKLTMLGVTISPLQAETWVERGVAHMVRQIREIGSTWRNGDNYLMASGRCMAIRVSHLKKMRVPEKVINGDMFLYLENKRLNGKFAYNPRAEVFIKCPQTLKEQIGPSSRFQYSLDEMRTYFDFDVESEYKIPVAVTLNAVVKGLISSPVDLILYMIVFAYTRIKKQQRKITANTLWKVEASTKAA
jgi:GT2 family glycosyltransferase